MRSFWRSGHVDLAKFEAQTVATGEFGVGFRVEADAANTKLLQALAVGETDVGGPASRPLTSHGPNLSNGRACRGYSARAWLDPYRYAGAPVLEDAPRRRRAEYVPPDVKEPWPRSDRLQVIGVFVAIVSCLAGAVVSIAVPEIRCHIHLQHCTSGVANVDSNWTGVPASIFDTAVDPAMPYAVAEPPATPAPPQTHPLLELSVSSITNRGKPVPVNLSGSNFFAGGAADITWYRPDGSVAEQDAAVVDDQGLFGYAMLWVPRRSLGVKGNDGTWKAEVTDRISGNTARVQFSVNSDGFIPAIAKWPAEPYQPVPFVAAELHAGTSGALCLGPGTLSMVALSGFTPRALVEIAYYRPDGHLALRQGVRVDGYGSLSLVPSHWKIAACAADTEFDYRVVATEQATGRSADGGILLNTKSS